LTLNISETGQARKNFSFQVTEEKKPREKNILVNSSEVLMDYQDSKNFL